MGISNFEYQQMLARQSARNPQPAPAQSRESKLHEQIIAKCRQWGLPYIHARMDRAHTCAVGMPDFVIVLPEGKVLWVECKSHSGKLRPEQLAWMYRLASLGHQTAIVRSFRQFLDLIVTQPKAMKISAGKPFEPAPEFTGRAVCVDVTDLKKVTGEYGEQEVFSLIFEIDKLRDDGKPWTVWSRRFTPTLGEKSNLRKFIRQWYGRDLVKKELENFDTEDLVGKSAILTITHETGSNGTTYANVALCQPLRNEEPLMPSEHYTRLKDRNKSDKSEKADWDPEGKEQGRAFKQTGSGGKEPSDPGLVKIHVGNNKGLELRDLDRDAIQKLIDNWYAKEFLKKEKPTADDKRLADGLIYYKAKFEKESEPEDDVDY